MSPIGEVWHQSVSKSAARAVEDYSLPESFSPTAVKPAGPFLAEIFRGFCSDFWAVGEAAADLWSELNADFVSLRAFRVPQGWE